jgi:hypothetical protein
MQGLGSGVWSLESGVVQRKESQVERSLGVLFLVGTFVGMISCPYIVFYTVIAFRSCNSDGIAGGYGRYHSSENEWIKLHACTFFYFEKVVEWQFKVARGGLLIVVDQIACLTFRLTK